MKNNGKNGRLPLPAILFEPEISCKVCRTFTIWLGKDSAMDRFPKLFADFLTVHALILYNDRSRHLSGNVGESFL